MLSSSQKIISFKIRLKDFPKNTVEKFLILPTRSLTAASIRSGVFNSDDATLNEVLRNISEMTRDVKMDDYELILKVFNAGQKFKLPRLIKECADALLNMVDSQNALDLLKIAVEYELSELEEEALSVILR